MRGRTQQPASGTASRHHGADRARPFEQGVESFERDAVSTIVVFYVRSQSGGHDRESALVDRLEALRFSGAIGDLLVRMWPRALSLEPTRDARTRHIHAYRRFEAWARENEVSIHPPFVVRSSESAFVDDSDEVLYSPMVFLTVYDNDGLVGIYPCSRHGRTITIDDWIGRIAPREAGETVTGGDGSREPPAESPREAIVGPPQERPATDHGPESRTEVADERERWGP